MSRFVCFVCEASLAWLCCTTFVFAAEPASPNSGATTTTGTSRPPSARSGLVWLTDYTEAWSAAERQEKMLLVLFRRSDKCKVCEKLETETLADPELREKLSRFVRVRLPLDAKASIGGQQAEILKHPDFAEMLGLPGLAILDLARKNAKFYGHVVSVFPFLDDQGYTAEQIKVMLELPPGTLTQRTLIYAVRTHPEHPQSTDGEADPTLLEEAEGHADYQARIRLQGHHAWESRFHRINGRLPAGCLASEVCAESWPGQGLLASAIECVRSWRQSSGHWGAVRERHLVYGYDIKRGDNGIWYATGIFGRR